jgi:hypothetical protein
MYGPTAAHRHATVDIRGWVLRSLKEARRLVEGPIDDLFPAAPRRGNGGSGAGRKAVRAGRAREDQGKRQAAGYIDLQVEARDGHGEIVRRHVSVFTVIPRQAHTLGRIDGKFARTDFVVVRHYVE